ncbi:MAG: CoA pyrophosphatase [Hyphomicrobiaceae bacterium]
MTTSLQMPKATVDASAFRRRAGARLRRVDAIAAVGGATQPVSNGPSDFDLNPDYAALAPAVARPAAVLIGVVMRQPLSVLFTLRTAHLAAHAGQVAFPGGKVEPGDSDPTATALREAEEEIGLERRLVEPLGFLDTYRTGTGFAIHPLVALVKPAFDLKPDPNEVADVFEVPLEFLMHPANARLETRFWRGRDRRFYALSYGGYDIWGATAGILHHMRERLFEE